MKKAIIFHGGWDGHTPVETSAVFKSILEENGFEVTVTDSMDFAKDYDNVAQYDLIIPVWTMGEIPGDVCTNICKAVAEGSGLAGCHGGMCDSFRNSTEWQFMTGAQWVAHPGNDGTPYEVNLVPGNEFTEGLTDFHVESEQYYIHIDPAVKVYATTTFPVADGPHAANGEVKVPVVFTKLWGKGRVFYNSLGHTYKSFDTPQARELMRRGFLWAAEGKRLFRENQPDPEQFNNTAKMY